MVMKKTLLKTLAFFTLPLLIACSDSAVIKKVSLSLLLLLSLLVVACTRDVVSPIDDENSKETALFREQCWSLVCGRWSQEDSAALAHIKQQYYFTPDGSFDGHMLIMKRDSVSVDGKKVVTDWENVVDNDVYGRWKLLYDSKLKKRVIHMDYASYMIFQSYLYFESVNDSVLEVSSPLSVDRIIKMRRNN